MSIKNNGAGFVGGRGTYTHDGNGNLTNEPYKGLAVISYDVLNRTDKITFTSSVNRYIDYTYDSGGNLLRKRQYDNVGGVATLQNTTDYLDGFVYTTVSSTQTLSYFAMPEGRVLFSSGSFTQEYIITDQQGNARISFNNTGPSGTAKVVQENSYYAFGLIMPGSAVTSGSNKHLYNSGSEWQSDYSNLPDYYQTYYRNYDAAIGRWVGIDPAAEGAESMSSYQYAGNNPVMFNDPLGDLLPMPGSHDAPSWWNNGPYYQSGVSEQLQEDAQNFYQAVGAAGDAEAAAGSNDMASINGTGSYSVFGTVFLSTLDNLHTQSHDAFINNTIVGDIRADETYNGVATYVDVDGKVSMSTGSRHSYLVNQVTDGASYAWNFLQIDVGQGGETAIPSRYGTFFVNFSLIDNGYNRPFMNIRFYPKPGNNFTSYGMTQKVDAKRPGHHVKGFDGATVKSVFQYYLSPTDADDANQGVYFGDHPGTAWTSFQGTVKFYGISADNQRTLLGVFDWGFRQNSNEYQQMYPGSGYQYTPVH